MTIHHHPSEELLMRFASGALEGPFDIAIAAHLDACVLCREEVAMWEGVGGAMLDEIAPAEMTQDAFARTLAALDRTAPAPRRAPNRSSALPASLRRYRVGREFPIGPGIYKRNIWKAKNGTGRAFLLRARPGLELPRHGHGGTEMTYVVQGGYSDEHGHYEPGDFMTADTDHLHQPHVDQDGECVLLIASHGRPIASGIAGLIMRFFM
ncbi:MAG: transcriptional regulator [Alphaproteobacteria bacterium]|nr:transcriptional regulator [Alphaproteobacteria bacterium]